MFAILAFVCFLLALIDVQIGELSRTDLGYLGFALLALHLAINIPIPYIGRR